MYKRKEASAAHKHTGHYHLLMTKVMAILRIHKFTGRYLQWLMESRIVVFYIRRVTLYGLSVLNQSSIFIPFNDSHLVV